MVTARIAIEGLNKSFSTPVLKQVALQVAPGSIHGLVGENGAGKSTLINIISGLLAADAGVLAIDGRAYSPKSRREALAEGLALASQELSLIDTLSVAENIFLTSLPQKALGIDRPAMRKQAEALMELVGLDHISPETKLAQLSLAEKQLVELAKALSMPQETAKLLILDEPTSALTSPQADRLHQIIKQRAASGLSVIYITHRLDDVIAVCDTISVLRDGVVQLTAPSTSLTSNDLIREMSGEDLLLHSNDKSRKIGELRLSVEQLSSADFPQPISLQCHRGEILGIAGLAGAGRSELLQAIYGLSAERRGRVVLSGSGADVLIDSASSAVRNGMAFIAEDRKSQGIFSGKSISLNTTVAGLSKLGGGLGAILPRREQRVSEELIARLRVKCEGPLQTIDRLSGGNQQKVLFARWLQTESDVWLLDEPTRGVDVGSKLAIHDQLRQLRDQGAAMLIVSSELEELTALCDRILVLSNKKAVATYDRGQWSKEVLLAAAFSEHKGERAVAGKTLSQAQ